MVDNMQGRLVCDCITVYGMEVWWATFALSYTGQNDTYTSTYMYVPIQEFRGTN